jgi:hypothetical protein
MKNVIFWVVTPFASCKNVSEECIASIIKVRRISELGTTSAVTCSYFTDSAHPDDGGDMFLQKVGFYKSHVASHPRRQHCSGLQEITYLGNLVYRKNKQTP